VATEADFLRAAEAAEERLGLQNHPRAIVIHEKHGRRHAHAVWSRIDPETMRATNMAFYKQKLTTLSRELYLEHDWPLPAGMN
jgi:Relaxase/Mobilisation nuclease domain